MDDATRAEFEKLSFAFTGHTLLDALAKYRAEALALYPHKRELIDITLITMKNFWLSDYVREFKLVPGTTPELVLTGNPLWDDPLGIFQYQGTEHNNGSGSDPT